MKKPILLVLILLIVAVIIPDDAEAQRRRRYKRLRKKGKKVSRYSGKRRVQGRFRPYSYAAVGINAGTYFGDLAPLNRNASADFSFTRPGVAFSYGRRFNPYASVRANLNYVQLRASDFSSDINGTPDEVARHSRNLSFRNNIIELSTIAEVDILPNQGSSASRVAFTPFLFGGIGILYHNPEGQVPNFDTHNPLYNPDDPQSSPAETRFSNAEEWVSLRQFGTEGQNIAGSGVRPYSNFQLSVPFGVGFRLRLPDNFDAAIEFGYRILFFDYLDDVSGQFRDLTDFDDPLARAFADRSIEDIDILSGSQRDLAAVAQAVGGLSIRDGVRFRSSFGSEGEIRGNPDDNDSFFVTQIKLIYNFGGVKRRAKFR